MAKDIVEAVRNAEIKANQTENDAQSKSEQIIQKAGNDAKVFSTEQIIKAKKLAETKLKAAELESKKLFENANNEALQEIAVLKKKAEQKEAEAVKLVYSELV